MMHGQKNIKIWNTSQRHSFPHFAFTLVNVIHVLVLN